MNKPYISVLTVSEFISKFPNHFNKLNDELKKDLFLDSNYVFHCLTDGIKLFSVEIGYPEDIFILN